MYYVSWYFVCLDKRIIPIIGIRVINYYLLLGTSYQLYYRL